MNVTMTDPQPHYWCHKCQTTIQPDLPGFICPTCKGDFIEEIEDTAASRQQQPSRTAAPQSQPNVGQLPPFSFAFQPGYTSMQSPPFPPGQFSFPQLFQSLFNAASQLAQQSAHAHTTPPSGQFNPPVSQFVTFSMPAFVNIPHDVPPTTHPFARYLSLLLYFDHCYELFFFFNYHRLLFSSLLWKRPVKLLFFFPFSPLSDHWCFTRFFFFFGFTKETKTR
jgi:hypothetical protein